jgi:hypothetical protein
MADRLANEARAHMGPRAQRYIDECKVRAGILQHWPQPCPFCTRFPACPRQALPANHPHSPGTTASGEEPAGCASHVAEEPKPDIGKSFSLPAWGPLPSPKPRTPTCCIEGSLVTCPSSFAESAALTRRLGRASCCSNVVLTTRRLSAVFVRVCTVPRKCQ